MEKVLRFDGNLDMFKNIVLLYKNENGETFLGSTTNDKNAPENHKSCIVLYKESLPQDRDYVMGWNYLDDHSMKQYLVYNDHVEVAVDDFLAAHNVDKTWQDIDYTVVDNTTAINDKLTHIQLANQQVYALATMK